jgi:hypothetical protein
VTAGPARAAYDGIVIIHHGRGVSALELLLLGLVLTPLAIRSWILLGVLWTVVALALVWRHRTRGGRDGDPPPWAV